MCNFCWVNDIFFDYVYLFVSCSVEVYVDFFVFEVFNDDRFFKISVVCDLMDWFFKCVKYDVDICLSIVFSFNCSDFVIYVDKCCIIIGYDVFFYSCVS